MRKFFVAFALCVGIVAGGAARAENNCTGATYYDADTDTCVACPDGYDYNTDSGKTDITQCQIHCDAGTWNGEYTQLEYIESTGTQWINTSIIPDANIRIVTSFVMPSNPRTNLGWVLGSRTSDFSIGIHVYPNYVANQIRFDFKSKYTAFCSATESLVNKAVVVDFNDNFNAFVYDENNNLLCSTSLGNPGNAQSTEPLAIFGFTSTENTANGNSTGFPFKIFYVRIYNGPMLVRNFIPARRNSDGVLGMYDMVTGQFFTNSGTGEFIAGPDVGSIGACVNVGAGYWAAASTVNFGSLGTKNACPAGAYSDIENASACQPCAGATYNDKTAAASCIACPDGYDYNTDSGKTDITQCQIHCDAGTYESGYTRLEYIESTGTQWINTSIIPDANIRIVTSFVMPSNPRTNLGWVLGSRTSDFSIGIHVYPYYIANQIRFDLKSKYTAFCSATESLVNKAVVVDFNDNFNAFVYDENNNLLCSTSLGNPGNAQSTEPLAIFGFTSTENTANGNSTGFPVKIFYVRIYNGPMLVRDFIPARRDSDNVVGMYDTVTGQFFTNAGTGEFIAGPVVGACVNVGVGYWAAASTVNFGDDGVRNACPVGTTTVGYGHGADSANDCGRVLHIGDYVLYARRDRVTSPSLNIRIPEEGIIYYINLGSANHDLSRLHLMLDGVQYTAYDDSLYYGERNFDTGEQIVQ